MEKKFERASRDKKLAGVCAGVAHYFNIDPTIVRILWIVATAIWGTGLLIYIVCALIMPVSNEF